MCNPSVALGMQTAGAVNQTVGSYFAARGQKASLRHQANISDINAQLSELSAQGELRAGQREVQKSKLATANLKGTQRASMAANGIALDSDSAVNILTTTDMLGEIDANTIDANAARSAWGYRTQGTNYKNEATMARAGAKGISPWMSAGTSLLTGAADVASSYYIYNKLGAFDKKGKN